uniref:Uncharacterized protein n=1 Tax=Pithovirus LCPAC304 TaxID=2506594 RepID=A0A481Z990_9VIRU|nr:MAG: hypothetical protein LCPAC304_05230 [Pithovirus LCPAC304]
MVRKKMETLTLCERGKIVWNKSVLGVDCGVLDQGIYYLVAIVLKDHIEGKYIVINGEKRAFLTLMLENTNNETLYKYLLQKIVTTSCTCRKWKKWVRFFLHEYQCNVDVIIGTEMKCATEILEYYPELLGCVQGIDLEEDYIDFEQLGETFQIVEMVGAVKRVCSEDSGQEEWHI